MSDEYLNRLQANENKLVVQMQEIVKRAGDESRDLSPEERENLDKWDADFDRVRADKTRLLQLEAKTKLDDASREAIAPVLREQQRGAAKPAETDNDRLIQVFKGELRGFDTARTIPVGYGSDLQYRALQSEGGSAIPVTFHDQITVYERTLNPMMEVATVLSTSTGNPITWPRLTADAGVASGTVTAEAAGITEGDATISSITFGAFKRAYTSIWSSELGQDNVIGLDRLIANSIGRQIGLAWGTAFTTGSGSADANGFLTAIGTTTQLGTATGTTQGNALDTFLGPADLLDAFFSLAAPYRANATWMVSNSGYARLAKFRSTTGEFLYQGPNVLGAVGLFYGRPIYENPAMAAVGSATIAVAVGDFSQYIIRDVVPIRVDISTEYKFNTDQIALRVITRRDGDLPDTTAIRAIRSANT